MSTTTRRRPHAATATAVIVLLASLLLAGAGSVWSAAPAQAQPPMSSAQTSTSTTPAPTTPAPTTGATAGSSSGAGVGVGVGALGGLDAADTHGLSIGKYQLSVDTGGATSPMKLITNGLLLSGTWEAYRWTVGVGVSLINTALQMSWIDYLVDTIKPLAITLQTHVINTLGLRNLALALMGIWVAFIIIAGRYARAISQLLLSSLIAALSVGVLTNPVAVITGPDGLLYTSRDVGQAVATVIVSDGKSNTADPNLIQQQTGGALVDTFVRLPHQLLNYGEVIDGGPCESAYDGALAGGPYDSDDDSARGALGGCKEELKDYADDPGWTGVASGMILTPAGGALIVLAIVLVVLLFLATLTAVFYAVKLILDLILAIAGSERAGLWGSIVGVLASLLLTAAALILLALYCVFLAGVLTANSAQDAMSRFLLVDVMVIAFIVVTLRARKAIADRARRIGERAAQATGGRKAEPVKMPALSHAKQAAAQFASTRTALGRGNNRGGTASAVGGNPAHRVLARVAGNRVVKTGLTAASLAGGAAGLAAKATIGLPIYGPRAARAVKTATKLRAGAARSTLNHRKTQGKAFAQEYRDGLGLVPRAGRASARGARNGVVAAGIGLSNPGSGPAPQRPPAASAGTNRGRGPTPRTVQAARARAAQRAASQHRPGTVPNSVTSAGKGQVFRLGANRGRRAG